ncbi:hypothetical protein BDL97_06G064700 [Sphagnum fallax]|nr:hypothetical protein BDL97_06G064700 [Sphagnum fallax]
MKYNQVYVNLRRSTRALLSTQLIHNQKRGRNRNLSFLAQLSGSHLDHRATQPGVPHHGPDSYKYLSFSVGNMHNLSCISCLRTGAKLKA